MYYLVSGNDRDSWSSVLRSIDNYDVYHLAEYQCVPTGLGGEDPRLLVVESNGGVAALPFLVRSLDAVEGFAEIGGGDATSAYGYPGAIANIEPNDEFVADFRRAMEAVCDELGIVSLFVRQHPLIPTDWLFAHYCDIVELSMTIAIDLSPDEAEIRRSANSNHRRNLKKTDRLCPVFERDASWKDLDAFIEAYEATMKRNRARESYYFSRSYYEKLRDGLSSNTHLFHTRVDGEIASSAIVFTCGEFVQYHLGGTSPLWLESGVARWTLEHVRRWAKREGFGWFHLGGGVGSTEDALFRFKAGFSKSFHKFSVVRYIHDNAKYEELCRRRAVLGHKLREDFFPVYRS